MLESFKQPLPASIEAYVNEFIRASGYEPVNLSRDDYQEIFRLLARQEEFETDVKYRGQNWELSFAPLSRREQHLQPIIERRLKQWSQQNRLSIIDAGEKWPDGKNFALCLTHDIDILHEYPNAYYRHLKKTLMQMPARARVLALGRLSKFASMQWRSLRRPKTPPLEIWTEAETKYGFNSTLYFMANHISTDWKDGYYYLNDTIDYGGSRTVIGDVARQLSSSGWDIGLHGGILSHLSFDVLSQQKSALEEAVCKEVTSTRQHYLCFDILRTPLIQEKAGFTIDSTLGSNINTDFRCGTGLPFLIFDVERGEATSLLEAPLVVQDNALEATCGGQEDLMVRACSELLERVAEVNGCITLLWHNQHRPRSRQFRVYQRILERANELGAWGCSMKQLESWWRGRMDSSC